MTEELELRYAVDDPAAVEAWLDEHFWPADVGPMARWTEVDQADRYFDTADGVLAQAGYGARLRITDDRTTVTLKSDIARSGALHRRREIEAAAADALAAAAWPESEARRLVEQLAAGSPLVERFTIRQRRRVRDLRRSDAALQVSIDRLQVEHGGRIVGRAAILEVELRDGDPGALREVDALMSDSDVVRPEPRNKMAIAQELISAHC